MKKYKLESYKFIDYMFQDKDDYLYWGKHIAEELSGDGKITLTMQGMLDRCGDIPIYYFDVEDEDEHPEYIDPKNVELVDEGKHMVCKLFWYDWFVDYVMQYDSNVYNSACKYADKMEKDEI